LGGRKGAKKSLDSETKEVVGGTGVNKKKEKILEDEGDQEQTQKKNR